MEQAVTTKKQSMKSKPLSTVAIRVGRETHRKILSELLKINKKQFGKKVRVDKLLSLALSLLNESHFETLQQQSLSNQDRLKMQYKDYISKNGNVSYDEFIGKILNGDIFSAVSSKN